jgi:hypothetical protein
MFCSASALPLLFLPHRPVAVHIADCQVHCSVVLSYAEIRPVCRSLVSLFF